MPKPTLKVSRVNLIELSDWNAFVEKVYDRPYNFQQQAGCRDRGSFSLTVPSGMAEEYDSWPDTVQEIVNHPEMGVNFAAWLARDPKQKLPEQEYNYELGLWWERNFYPAIWAVADDLYDKGYLDAGEYTIEIDW